MNKQQKYMLYQKYRKHLEEQALFDLWMDAEYFLWYFGLTAGYSIEFSDEAQTELTGVIAKLGLVEE